MLVTLHLFSGRANPRWRLTPSQARELRERVSAGDAPLVPDETPVLGLRGFTVDSELQDVATQSSLPARFAVAPLPAVSVATAPKRSDRAAVARSRADMTADASKDLSSWLLTTAAGVLDEKTLETVSGAIQEGRVAPGAAVAEVAPQRRAQKAVAEKTMTRALAAPACEPFLTPIQDAYWGDPPVRFHNNCYNYATNFVSNTLAQPGRRSGHQYTAFDCQSVAQAAGFDGYLQACEGTLRVAALGIWPGFDFHWWRLHPGGFWAHKIGTSPVQRRDNLGRILGNGLTPENCDRGPYTQFCGLFFAPLGVSVF
jgi:hypothetical protein